LGRRQPPTKRATFLSRCPRRRAHHAGLQPVKRWTELDLDRAEWRIRDFDHAFSKDGGLAVLYGNLAPMAAS
jgi:hypothetical protein